MKLPALAWLAKQFVGIDERALSVVNRFRRAVDGKAAGEPWCVCFAFYLASEVDALFAAMGMTSALRHELDLTESTQVLWAHAKTVSTTPVVGSVVVWRSKANPLHGHCGIVVAIGPDGIMTIEGNTSEPGAVANEANGRGVWRKTRFGGNIPGFDRLGFVLPWA